MLYYPASATQLGCDGQINEIFRKVEDRPRPLHKTRLLATKSFVDSVW